MNVFGFHLIYQIVAHIRSHRTTWILQRHGVHQLSEISAVLEGARICALSEVPDVPILPGSVAV